MVKDGLWTRAGPAAAPSGTWAQRQEIRQAFEKNHKFRCLYDMCQFSNVGDLFKDTVNTVGPNKTKQTVQL